jgi:homoserine O-acetyltransferase/O-succinyltransferase
LDWATETGQHALGTLPLQSGESLPDAELNWKSYGTLAPAKDNVILYPTSYSAHHTDLEPLIGPDGVLDPTRWFIVIPDMFTNGLSSSPSNNARFPSLVTTADNVRAQRRFLSEAFGVEQLACVYGFSMGAQQAYHWAALFPDAVVRAIVVCGSARTSVHNQVFLRSLLAALEAAPEHVGGGRFSATPTKAMRAFTRIYAGWAMSQDWYRAGLHLTSSGAADLDDFLDNVFHPRFARRKAEDLYAQAKTWIASDISANELYEGDLVRALQAIKARVLLMPSRTDLYFPVADNANEIPHLARAELRPIPSIGGHRAGSPSPDHADYAFLRANVRAWLE